MEDNIVYFDKDTPKIEQANKVRSLLAVNGDDETIGSVEFDLLVLEAGKNIGEAVKLVGNELPELADANKYVDVYGGSNGKILTYKGNEYNLEPNTNNKLFWDGLLKQWEIIDSVPISKVDSDKYFEFLKLGMFPTGSSILPPDFLTDYDMYWDSGYLSGLGEPTSIVWDPVTGFGWSNNLKNPVPLIKGGRYLVKSTIALNASVVVLNSLMQVDRTFTESSEGVVIDGNVRIIEIDLTNAHENKFIAFSARDYNKDTHPIPHSQWFSLMDITTLNDVFFAEIPQFKVEERELKHDLSSKKNNEFIEALDFSGNPKNTFGESDTIYKIKVPTDNRKLRIKFEVMFNEDVNLSDGSFANTFGILKHYNRSFRFQMHKRNAAVATDNFSAFGTVPSQNIRSASLFGIHYSPDNRINQTFTSSKIFPWGDFLFGLRYNGDLSNPDNRDLCLTITNYELRIWKETGNITLFSHEITEATTVEDIYNSLLNLGYLDLNINSITDKLAKDMVKIEKIKLSSEYFNQDGTLYWDSGICWIPSSIWDRWNTVEIVFDNGACYYSFNGETWEVPLTINFTSANTVLYVGGEVGSSINIKNSVRNLHVNMNNLGGAEVVSYSLNYPAQTPKVYSKKLVSEYNPLIYIFVGHEVVHTSESEILLDTMACSTDRLEKLFAHLKRKGYVSVDLDDVMRWKKRGDTLPKRCFVPIFDDYRWAVFLNPDIRKVFERFDVKGSLALITERANDPAYPQQPAFGGFTYDPPSLFRQMNMEGWNVHSHTKDHRYLRWDKTSEIYKGLNEDALDAYQAGVKTSVMTYPQGNVRNSVLYNLANSVFKIGLVTANGNNLPNANFSDYYLHRVELGQRNPIVNLLDSIV